MRRRYLAWLLCACLLAPSLSGGAGAARVASPWDFSNDAWAYLRARTPAERNVYRPTWLPERFRRPGGASTFASGLVFGVTYVSERGDSLIFGSTANSCGGNGVPEPVAVRGYPGFIVRSADCNDEIRVYWLEGEEVYGFQGARRADAANPPTREEMLRIAASLEPVRADGRPITPVGPPAEECFAETGQCIAGRFLERWRATGGATINGFPLTGEFTQALEDGEQYRVQYFERVRLEYHPENPAPYDILLGQFGRRIRPAEPPVAADPNAPQYFPETGHNLSGWFYNYWREYGLIQFGYPIGEERIETLEDGKQYRVQYFERARLEYHPENPYPYQILPGQFGRQILAEVGAPARRGIPGEGR